MNGFTAGLSAVNAELTELVHRLTPATAGAWKTVVDVYQVSAISHLAYGLLALVLLGLVVATLYAIYCIQRPVPETVVCKFSRYETGDTWTIWERANFDDVEIFIIALTLILGLGGIVCFGFALLLVDVWNWVALFHPQLYAAHEILQAVMQHQ